MEKNKYTTAFLGTPDFAVPALKALIEDPRFEMKCVVTQPDRPAGRGQNLVASPVKALADKCSIPVFQPISLKSISVIQQEHSSLKPILKGEKSAESLVEFLNQLPRLDILVTAAYGNIIPPSLLNYAKAPMVNIHPSLLPRWRGAAPLQYAIFSNDCETGVCLMQVEEGLDTGPVFYEERTPINKDDTLGSMHDRLSEIGRKLLIDNIENIILGKITPRVQDNSLATYAHKWEKTDALLNWNESAEILERRIRASNPIPGARTYHNGEMLKVFSGVIIPKTDYSGSQPGTVVGVESNRIVISCGDGNFLGLSELQVPGRKRMPTGEVLKGYKINRGDLLTVETPNQS